MSRALRSALLAIAASVGLATSAHAASYAVTTNIDGGAGSLRQAIIDANASPGADTITLAAQTAYNRSQTGPDGAVPAASGDLDISDDLTITGDTMSSTSVSAIAAGPTATDRVFEITGGAKVTISRIHITGGYAPQPAAAATNPGGSGGGILVTDGDLTLEAVDLSGNTAYGGGGGVSIVKGALTIDQSRLAENISEVSDGGAVAHPDLAGAPSATISIRDTNIVENKADTETGGGIAHRGPGLLTLTRAVIHSNTANWGGGLAVGGATKVVDSRIYANKGRANDSSLGGGIVVQGAGPLEITQTEVSGNTAGHGGGLYQLPGSGLVAVLNSTFSGNAATEGSGAMEVAGDGATLLHATLAENSPPTVSACPPSTCSGPGHAITATSSIFAGPGANCTGQVISGGHNIDSGASCGFGQPGDLASTDPKLGPLADFVSWNLAHGLLAGSPAIGAADQTLCPERDQVLKLRYFDACDIGAFEFDSTAGPSAPSTAITSGPAAATNDADAVFAFAATPSSGATFECWVDSDTPADCTSPFTATALTDGPHTFHVRASAAGLVDPTPAEWGFTVDTKAPAASAAAAADAPFGFAVAGGFVGTVRLTTGATDPVPSSGSVTLRCVLDPPTVPASFAAIPATPGCPATLATPGVHQAYVAAVDAAGNESPVTATTFTILTSPDTTITKAPDGPINHAPTFAFTATIPGATFECAVDGGSFRECVSPYTLPLPADGKYLFRVRARIGEARDPISATADFVIDTVAPTTNVGVEAASDGKQVGPGSFAIAVNLQRSITDPEPAAGGGELRCVLDPPTPPATFADIPASPGCPLRFTGAGAHRFYAAASDGAGNRGGVSEIGFTLLEAPDTTITDGPSGPTFAAPQFSFTSTIPGSTFQCSVDGGRPQTCTSPVPAFALGAGGHRFAVQAISPDGIVDPTPADRVFTLESKTFAGECTVVIDNYGVPFARTECNTFFTNVTGLASCPPSGRSSGGVVCRAECPVGAKCTMTTRVDSTDNRPGDNVSANGYASISIGNESIAGAGARAQISCDDDPGAPNATSPSCPRTVSATALGPLNAFYSYCQYSRDDTKIQRATITITCKSTLTVEPAPVLGAVVGNTGVGVLVPSAGTLTVGASAVGTKKALVAAGARAGAAPKKKSKKKKPLIAASTVVAKAAGPVQIDLKLSTEAKTTLAKKGRLPLSLTTTFKPADGGPTVTKTQKVTLTPKPKACKKQPTLEKPAPCKER